MTLGCPNLENRKPAKSDTTSRNVSSNQTSPRRLSRIDCTDRSMSARDAHAMLRLISFEPSCSVHPRLHDPQVHLVAHVLGQEPLYELPRTALEVDPELEAPPAPVPAHELPDGGYVRGDRDGAREPLIEVSGRAYGLEHLGGADLEAHLEPKA